MLYETVFVIADQRLHILNICVRTIRNSRVFMTSVSTCESRQRRTICAGSEAGSDPAIPVVQIARQSSLYFGDFSSAVTIPPIDNGEQHLRIVGPDWK